MFKMLIRIVKCKLECKYYTKHQGGLRRRGTCGDTRHHINWFGLLWKMTADIIEMDLLNESQNKNVDYTVTCVTLTHVSGALPKTEQNILCLSLEFQIA